MNRRTFLNTIAALAHAVVGLCVAIPGVRFLFDAVTRRRRGATFVPTVRLADLKPGVPTRVVVRQDRWDAYIHYPPGPIGAVWLIRTESPADQAAVSVRCLQTICPHLGCVIDFAPDRNVFVCPCHTSEFDRSGRALSGPSPRGMDALRCRVSDPDERGDRWVEVEYRAFKTGIPEQEPLA